MIYKATEEYPTNKQVIFLAGSIEEGSAEDWQKYAGEYLDEKIGTDNIIILNPRRDKWDNSIPQKADNEQFRNQVLWESKALYASTIILFYFSPGTKSPISLLELGLYANNYKELFVVCPDGYWKQGNVEIVSEIYGLNFYKEISPALDDIVALVKELLA